MPRRDVMSESKPRAALITEMKKRLVGESYPRVIVLFILIVSGGCAFLFSAISLSAGFESMALRYLLAALVGYAAFILLIRAWIAYRRGHLDTGLEDLLDVELPNGRTPPSDMFGGGRSGGGGAGGSWQPAPLNAPGGRDLPLESSPWMDVTAETSGSSLDLDELWWLVVAGLLTVAGLAAVLYVVYVAPLLLAEVGLDAALVSAVYRRMRREDARHWVEAVLRHTWAPALALTAFVTLIGFVLQTATPDARSIGDVLRGFGG